MTVTRLPISWHHPVCAARRPGKAVLVASGPVAGQERLGHVARNRAGEVDVISTPGCSRSQASRASAVRARAAHQHVCASRRRSGSSRSSDAGAGRSRRPRVPAVPAARATAGAAARARRCAGRPPWPALRAPAHDGADLPGQPGRVPLIAFEQAGKLPSKVCRTQSTAAHLRRGVPTTIRTRRPSSGTLATIRSSYACTRLVSMPQTGQGTAPPGPGSTHPSVTSSMTSGDSQKTPCSQAGPTSRTAHREASRHAVTTESATEPI